MISYNHPYAFNFSEKQVIVSPNITGVSIQVPLAYYKIIFGAQALHFYEVKRQDSHLISIAVILFIVH